MLLPPEEEANRLYNLTRAQLEKRVPDAQLHNTTVNLCKISLDLGKRAKADSSYWTSVSIELNEITQK